MGKRVEFKVAFDLPEDATVQEAQAYVEDAVCTLKGSLQPPGCGPGGYDPDEPGDPMFELDPDSVRVTRLRKTK